MALEPRNAHISSARHLRAAARQQTQSNVHPATVRETPISLIADDNAEPWVLPLRQHQAGDREAAVPGCRSGPPAANVELALLEHLGGTQMAALRLESIVLMVVVTAVRSRPANASSGRCRSGCRTDWSTLPTDVGAFRHDRRCGTVPLDRVATPHYAADRRS